MKYSGVSSIWKCPKCQASIEHYYPVTESPWNEKKECPTCGTIMEWEGWGEFKDFSLKITAGLTTV